jgi:hypothetical protein
MSPAALLSHAEHVVADLIHMLPEQRQPGCIIVRLDRHIPSRRISARCSEDLIIFALKVKPFSSMEAASKR